MPHMLLSALLLLLLLRFYGAQDVEEVVGNAAAVGWAAHATASTMYSMSSSSSQLGQRAPLVALGIAGNVGRFGGGCIEFVRRNESRGPSWDLFRVVNTHGRHPTQEGALHPARCPYTDRVWCGYVWPLVTSQ